VNARGEAPGGGPGEHLPAGLGVAGRERLAIDAAAPGCPDPGNRQVTLPEPIRVHGGGHRRATAGLPAIAILRRPPPSRARVRTAPVTRGARPPRSLADLSRDGPRPAG